ncbi:MULTISPECIES: DNA ligase [unclassified Variovorax]|uniref:DNA ligase n=1 Tax=unclassified Variovorax TaxID=663243 RepID=UPI002575EC68|nr:MULTISPECIES: DNA ligase [unclassified Variovorax]MDM0086366.1 DNA ligase [Variovorax sp. J22G40]MDM0145377.1 DNA ligase [Variovorax sp. J2P1-31]
MPNRRSLLLMGLLAWAGCASPVFAAAPALMLAEVYRQGIALDDYWVSEKYDGLRGYWDGRQLWTRGGERVMAPAWFTAPLPAVPMDGELWAGRGRFEFATSTVRSQVPLDAAWREMRFMVFDLPAEPGDFTTRLAALRRLLPLPAAPWVLPVAQQRATTHAALMAQMKEVVKMGGEGLVLHRGASLYRAERNQDLLKLKPYEDADARVVAHLPGKGRHEGRMGALMVEMPDGRRFKLGGGFSDAQRDDPPAVGRWVSYRFNGTTAKGLPRFARFLRVRGDLGP